MEFDDDDHGYVASELLKPFDELASDQDDLDSNPFTGYATIEMKQDFVSFGDKITLKVKVEEANKAYRVIWQANDGDERGWYEIGKGEEYEFILTEDIVDRNYRVVLRPTD